MKTDYQRGYEQGRFDAEMDMLNKETPEIEELEKTCKEAQQHTIKITQNLHRNMHTLGLEEEEQIGYLKALRDVIEKQLALLAPTKTDKQTEI